MGEKIKVTIGNLTKVHNENLAKEVQEIEPITFAISVSQMHNSKKWELYYRRGNKFYFRNNEGKLQLNVDDSMRDTIMATLKRGEYYFIHQKN